MYKVDVSMIMNTNPGGAKMAGAEMYEPVAYEDTRTAEMTTRRSFEVDAHWPRSKYSTTEGSGVAVGPGVGVGFELPPGDDVDEVHA